MAIDDFWNGGTQALLRMNSKLAPKFVQRLAQISLVKEEVQSILEMISVRQNFSHSGLDSKFWTQNL